MSLDPQVDLFREYSVPDEDKLSDEWYTPQSIVKPARKFLGRIDLDPCSCEAANKEVGATKIYTMEEDGLEQTWGIARTIWMNPPYSDPLPWMQELSKWAWHFLAEPCYAEALILHKPDPSTRWYKELMRSTVAICQLSDRVKYWGPSAASGNNFCSAIACVATRDRVDEFAEIFKPLGYVFEQRG